jgi:SAM-dependent methyltransferase
VLDLGAGMGRTLLLAASHPVRRVIGIELVPQFATAARENVARNVGILRAPVEVVTGDVLGWPIPPDVSVVYAFSPFVRSVFGRVLDAVLESIDAHPRPLRLVYAHPDEHDLVLGTGRAQVLDVIPQYWPTRPGWWRNLAVIVTYGLGEQPASRPGGRRPPRAALERWG